MSSGFLGSGVGPTAIKRRSGLAAPVPVAGAELLINPNFDADVSAWGVVDGTLASESSIVVAGKSVKGTAASFGFRLWQQITVAANAWLELSAYTYRPTGQSTSVPALRLGSSSILSDIGVVSFSSALDTWNFANMCSRATAANPYLNFSGVSNGTYGFFDSASARALSLASLLSTRAYASSDCDLSAAVTRTAGTQAGLCARLDSASSPANFIIAYETGAGRVRVDKCVAGVYTNIIDGAVTYAAGRVLRLVCSGNDVSVYYNGTQVGTTVTVSDAGIVSNTRHGLFSTYASNTFAGYVAA